MSRLAPLFALLLCGCTTVGTLSLGLDDDDDATTGDDDDATAEDPPRYADCVIEQEFAFPQQNRFEFSVHNFDSEGHNAFSERFLDADQVQSIDWRAFDSMDEIVLVESSRPDGTERVQSVRYEREYDDLDRQVVAHEYDADDRHARSYEVTYEGDIEQAIKTNITAPDGRIERVQYFTWEGEQLVKQENDVDGDGSINETLVWTWDGERADTLEMDRDGDGEFDLLRSHDYDEDDNLLRWEFLRIQQGKVFQWSEYGGSCYEQ